MSNKSRGLTGAFSQLQREKAAIDRQRRQRQDEDRAKLLPIKQEHERVVRAIEAKLNALASNEPSVLNIRQLRPGERLEDNIFAPSLISYDEGSAYEIRLKMHYFLRVGVQQPPRSTFLQRLVSPLASPQIVVRPTAQAYAAYANRPGSWTMKASLGELVLDPVDDLKDEAYARARLYESQVECLEQVKELLDDQKLAQVVFSLLHQRS